ncbi:citrate synthase-like protein [Paraphysoderma sedebokerense]|nr:citrate synthase-like protein [Paraphysoderma sedebokerense]
MASPATPSDTLTITDPQTGTTITVPIDTKHNTITGSFLKQLKIAPTNPPAASENDKVPCVLYDPGFLNTTACKSKISMVSAQGKLYYRGYSIEELCENSTFLEVAYLLVNGELPNKNEYENFAHQVMHHTYITTEVERQLATFRYDSHPMGMLISTTASLSTCYPESNPALAGDALYIAGPRENLRCRYHLPDSNHELEPPSLLKIRDHVRSKQIWRILGKLPTLGANVYRHRMGRSYNAPMPGSLNYVENFLYMLDKLNEENYTPDPVLVKSLDKMFILLAEGGSSCSTITMRHLASSGVDPYSAISGACGTLFGERKSSAVVWMLENQVKNVDNIPAFLDKLKKRKSFMPADNDKENGGAGVPKGMKEEPPMRLMGFGHRIYKTHDPRVKIVKDLALELYSYLHPNAPPPHEPSSHLIHLALKLEEAALSDPYFANRSLYPNIDYWSAIVFHTLGFPPDMFPVLTCIPRAAGYLAHWIESIDDKEYKIYRPRQLYQGHTVRSYVPVTERTVGGVTRDLSGIGLKSNPAATLRRAAGGGLEDYEYESEIQTLGDLQNVVQATRENILELAKKLSGSLNLNFEDGEDTEDGRGSPTSSGKLKGSPKKGLARRTLDRILHSVKENSGKSNSSMVASSSSSTFSANTTSTATSVGPGTFKRSASSKSFGTGSGSGSGTTLESKVAKIQAVATQISNLHNELQSLLAKQKELLELQKEMREEEHISDVVDLKGF